MRILAIDTGSNCVDWLMRCIDAGHEVLYYDQPRKDGSRRLAGKGIVPKLVDFQMIQSRYLDWCDICFLADNAHYTDLLEPFRQRGYPIFAPSPDAADLELDRAKGQQAMKKAGLDTIPGVEFNDYDAAAKFVKKHPTYLVSKPSGDADKALSYVADDAASLIHMLEDRWKKNGKYVHDAKKYGFILQERVHGVEFAVGGWFGPGGWSRWWYENLEYKKFLNGDLGNNTGEQGTLSMYVRDSKLADIALKPMTKQLEALEYVGFIDVSGMVKDDGSFAPFEFTCRPGWPTFYNQTATHEGDPAQWMLDLLNGRDTLQVKENTACVTVVVTIGDYPHGHLTNKEVAGVPIYNATDREHVHLAEVMMGEDVPVQFNGSTVRVPNYVTAGDYVLICSGTGDTVTGARRSAYAATRKIRMPMKLGYRTDIGAGRAIKGIPQLQSHGFALGFSF